MNRPNRLGAKGTLPLSADQMREHVIAIQRLMEAVMTDGEHYGRVPGSKKPSLWKPGAEKLCVAFHIEPAFVVEDLSTQDCYRFRVKCVGTHQITGTRLGEGMGSCSSLEQKYKWRRATVEEFDATVEERRRYKKGYDWAQKRPYEVMQVRADHHDIENTILKMACKRAHVAMTLNVTAASDIFTQDIEDLPEHVRENDEIPRPKASKIAQPRAKSKTVAPLRGVAAQVTDGKQSSGGTALSNGQQRILRARMQRAKLSEVDLVKVFGASLDSMTATQFKDIATWVRNFKWARS